MINLKYVIGLKQKDVLKKNVQRLFMIH